MGNGILKFADDVDKHWERDFNEKEEQERVRCFEGRSVEFQIKTGLSLLRAKSNIEHGDFILFLKKSGFTTPDIPERRMKLAKLYLQFRGYTSAKRINLGDDDVQVGMAMAYSENPHFAEFDSWRKGEFNANTFLRPKNTVVKRNYIGTLFGFKPSEIFTVVRQAIDKDYPKWNLNQKVEAIETLETIKNFCDQEIKHLSELESLSAKEQIKNSKTWDKEVEDYALETVPV
jgi:hypothetical protein